MITIIMLLSVETVNTADGVVLVVYEVGGKRRVVQPPFSPYYYSATPTGGTHVRRTLLSTLRDADLWKTEFPTTHALERHRNEHTLEDNIPFDQRIAIDVGFKCPSAEPHVLAWDIETVTANPLTPNPMNDTIRSIAVYDMDGDSECWTGKPRDTITQFLTYVKKTDPDVLADFYGRFYDVPCLVANCARLSITPALGRDGSTPYILTREFERRGKGMEENTVLIRGRVHFDVHQEADKDYTLTLAGIKDRTLNTVATHYGLHPIKDVDHAHIPDDRLAEVNLDDTRCTMELANVYLRNNYALSEYFDVPLNMMIRRSPSHLMNFFYGRDYGKKGIVTDGYNKDRFPWAFTGKRVNEGAVVRLYRSGVFFDVHHSDFASLYPSTMIAFNLDPETVSLVHRKPYTGHYRFEDKGDHAVVEVPDTRQDAQITVRVDLSFDSVTRLRLQNVLEERRTLKQQYQQTRDPKLFSQEWALKTVANATYGYHVTGYSRWGNVLVGIVTTAVGRRLLEATVQPIKGMIELDTDGFYYTGTYNTEAYNDVVNRLFPPCFALDAFQLTTKTYDGMISLNDKLYILIKDGTLTPHGSGLIGRHSPEICDVFWQDLARAIFAKQPPRVVLTKYHDLSRFPLNYFVMGATLSKRPDSYNTTTMYNALIQRVKHAGVRVRWGSNIKWVKTTGEYTPLSLYADEPLDYAYYQQRLASIAAKLLFSDFKAADRKRILSMMNDKNLEEWK